jgi:hypothetical protein
VHALELGVPIAELPTPYYARPAGSWSTLSIERDGLRILWMIFELYRYERQRVFFDAICVVLAIMSVGLAVPIFVTYLHQGIVPRFPTAILAS